MTLEKADVGVGFFLLFLAIGLAYLAFWEGYHWDTATQWWSIPTIILTIIGSAGTFFGACAAWNFLDKY